MTLCEMVLCAREAGRPGEAEGFRRALEIQEAKRGPDDRQVAVVLTLLGRCVRHAGRPGQAEALYRRALEITEAKLGTYHVGGVYGRRGGRGRRKGCLGERWRSRRPSWGPTVYSLPGRCTGRGCARGRPGV